MKVLYIGNQDNTGLRFVRWLVEAGIDARLIFPDNFNHSRSQPEWESPSLKERYPDWVQTFREKRIPYLFLNRKVKRLARHYDIILSTGFYILPVLLLNKPVVFLPSGRDLTQMPFWSDRLVNELHSYLYRKRIHKIRKILTDQEDCVWAARLLGTGDKIYRYPFLVDAREIERNVNTTLKSSLEKEYGHYQTIFFNPTRKNMDPARVDYKGIDKLLKAYRRFLDWHGSSNVLMVSGLHGLHVEDFKNRVRELDLQQDIAYTGHLPLPDLHAWFSLKNVVVFDQFSQNLNALSGIQREAMALGRPVVSATDIHSAAFKQAYGPDCPLLPAFDEQQIFRAMQALKDISTSPGIPDSRSTRQWIMDHLHYESRINELIRLLKAEYSNHPKG